VKNGQIALFFGVFVAPSYNFPGFWRRYCLYVTVLVGDSCCLLPDGLYHPIHPFSQGAGIQLVRIENGCLNRTRARLRANGPQRVCVAFAV
jgi:hypothetical protein